MIFGKDRPSDVRRAALSALCEHTVQVLLQVAHIFDGKRLRLIRIGPLLRHFALSHINCLKA
jgi:hypothetical protein